MKIKTNGNIIGIICDKVESKSVYNALIDYGCDSYEIREYRKAGKTIYCFHASEVPSTDFTDNFPKFYQKKSVMCFDFLVSATCDYFDPFTASIGGRRLVEIA